MSERPNDADGPVEQSAPDEGGDAACWAHRVCPECGRLNDAERPVRCEACGAAFD